MFVPESIDTEEELEMALSRPYPELVEMMKRLDGDILILGVGGKIGPSLARAAANARREAKVEKSIVGVDIFISTELETDLNQSGVSTIRCDLSLYDEVKALPKIKNVIFMAGRKFGDVGSEHLTWLMNAVVPGNVGQAFKESRIVVFSTGCVYDLLSAESGGSLETDAPQPVGEYANSCLGRERVFEYYSKEYGTPVLMFRLNYAVDLRYGVVVDIARDVMARRPVSLNVNAFNIIWQGDVVNRALLCLERTSSPPEILNVTGTETIHVEPTARRLAELLGVEVEFTGRDSGKAFLSNAAKSVEWFGPPKVSEEDLITLAAEWIKHGGKQLDKPTHFSVTDGQFLDEKR